MRQISQVNIQVIYVDSLLSREKFSLPKCSLYIVSSFQRARCDKEAGGRGALY
jgi:hypothetical protein